MPGAAQDRVGAAGVLAGKQRRQADRPRKGSQKAHKFQCCQKGLVPGGGAVGPGRFDLRVPGQQGGFGGVAGTHLGNVFCHQRAAAGIKFRGQVGRHGKHFLLGIEVAHHQPDRLVGAGGLLVFLRRLVQLGVLRDGLVSAGGFRQQFAVHRPAAERQGIAPVLFHCLAV